MLFFLLYLFIASNYHKKHFWDFPSIIFGFISIFM